MLVLSRRLGESVMISDEIEVVVTSISHGKIKLGFITRDGRIPIYRKEIYERMKGQRHANGNPPDNTDGISPEEDNSTRSKSK